jgi:hypothetical protein
MANKYRNESEIKVGGVKILLRPTFENCANLESALGGSGLPMIAYNLTKQKTPPMTQLARIIYECQAEKKYTLEQIWDYTQIEGYSVELMSSVLSFISLITAGDKAAPELSEEQIKKN